MAVPVRQAARELDIACGTLRRWIRQGAPVARRGRKGRGNAALVEPAVIRAWRAGGDGGRSGIDPVILAGELPELIAAACWDVHLIVEGPHKGEVARALAACWYQTTNALLDRLREDAPSVPEVEALPEKIDRLRAF